MNAALTTQRLEGVLIVGTGYGCGKTSVTAGLAAALIENGFQVQAFKPLAFSEQISFTKGMEQNYINKVTQQYTPVETLYAPSAWDIPIPLWNKMIESCKQTQYPCLIEAPGQVATPWRIAQSTVTDATDIAKQLGISVLLVAQADEHFLEETRAALTFLKARDITPIGLIRIQTRSQKEPPSPAEPLLIGQNFGIDFLGDLPYSPSISVAGQQQGNLVRLVQESIDLLPLQMGIGLKL